MQRCRDDVHIVSILIVSMIIVGVDTNGLETICKSSLHDSTKKSLANFGLFRKIVVTLQVETKQNNM